MRESLHPEYKRGKQVFYCLNYQFACHYEQKNWFIFSFWGIKYLVKWLVHQQKIKL